jgi:hypothetical protein
MERHVRIAGSGMGTPCGSRVVGWEGARESRVGTRVLRGQRIGSCGISRRHRTGVSGTIERHEARAAEHTSRRRGEDTPALALVDAHLPHLPAFARASAGAKLVEALLAVLDHLTRAAWLPARSAESLAALREANHRIAFARLLLRGMRERAYLSVDQHAYAAEALESIGRMVGAWLRAARRNNNSPDNRNNNLGGRCAREGGLCLTPRGHGFAVCALSSPARGLRVPVVRHPSVATVRPRWGPPCSSRRPHRVAGLRARSSHCGSLSSRA